ncbi:MAG TPA: hypothetical protein VJN64_07575, partial [Terriglobales bacterium]|nr:hypothetical protein [Terriglobales bacterium]
MCRFSFIFILSLAFSSTVSAQRIPESSAMSRQINGVIRLDGRLAPQGVLVLLDFAGSRETAPAGAGELARTMTDSSGKFSFDHLEQFGRNAGQELFAVTVHFTGYKNV